MKLARKTQKVFAENATNNGVFGSLQAGTGTVSNDIAQIQSLDAYKTGWNSATISSEKLPPLEEFQGLQYMQTSQIAYLMQEGIPEYDSGTTYYKGAVVKVITDSDYALYKCKVDETAGIAPTTANNWDLVYNTTQGLQTLANMEQDLTDSTTKYPSSAAVYNATQSAGNPTGAIIAWSTSTAPAGYLICDGSAVSRTTYSALFAVIGGIYSSGIYAYTSSGVDYFINKATPEVGDAIYGSDGASITATIATITDTGFTDSAGATYTRNSGNDKSTFNLPNRQFLTRNVIGDGNGLGLNVLNAKETRYPGNNATSGMGGYFQFSTNRVLGNTSLFVANTGVWGISTDSQTSGIISEEDTCIKYAIKY